MRRCSVIRFCLENSTFHGLMYTVHGRTPFQRFVWILFAVTAASVFIVYLVRNAKKYQNEPSSVRLDTLGTAFIPPDLHMCNINALSFHEIKEMDETSKSQFQAQLDAFTKRLGNQSPDFSLLNLIIWSNMNFSNLYQKFGHKPHEMIFHSDFGNEKHLNLPLEWTSNSEYFSCVRLPLRKLKENMTTMDILHLHLFLDAYQSNESYNNSFKIMGVPLERLNFYVRYPELVGPQGIIVFVTPPDLYPHEGSHTVLIQPHGHTFIKLRMEMIQKAQAKRNPCQDQEEHIYYYNRLLGGDHTTRYRKSFGDCVTRKKIETMWKNNPDCRCVMFNTPITSEHKHANICMKDIFNESKLRTQIECFKQFQKMQLRHELTECSAEKSCKFLKYTSEMWTSRWPSAGNIGKAIRQQLKKEVSTSSTHLGDLINVNANDTALMNFALVSIAPGEMKSLLIKEEMTYDFEKFICDTGGVAGLCIGVSFLTVFELVNVLHDLIQGIIRGKKLAGKFGSEYQSYDARATTDEEDNDDASVSIEIDTDSVGLYSFHIMSLLEAELDSHSKK